MKRFSLSLFIFVKIQHLVDVAQRRKFKAIKKHATCTDRWSLRRKQKLPNAISTFIRDQIKKNVTQCWITYLAITYLLQFKTFIENFYISFPRDVQSFCLKDYMRFENSCVGYFVTQQSQKLLSCSQCWDLKQLTAGSSLTSSVIVEHPQNQKYFLQVLSDEQKKKVHRQIQRLIFFRLQYTFRQKKCQITLKKTFTFLSMAGVGNL